MNGCKQNLDNCSTAARQARPAFTLVELLVVVGIIAVLISILVPALALVREAAITSKCLSNLKQVGIAIQTYANDHQFYLVPGDHFSVIDGSPTNGGGTWCDILVDGQYINAPIGFMKFPGDPIIRFNVLFDNDNILRCPKGSDLDVSKPFGASANGLPTSQTDQKGAGFAARASDINLQGVRTWYGINCAFSPQPAPNTIPQIPIPGPLPFSFLPYQGKNWHLYKFTQFREESTLPLVFDGTWIFDYDPSRINARHNNFQYTNVLFADNHCETLGTSSLPTQDWCVK